MDKYQEEMYSFFTHKGNFENMIKVINHFKNVRETLIQEFWDLVYDKLKEHVDEHMKGWEVGKDKNYFTRYPGIWIYKKEWGISPIREELPFVVSWESMSIDPHYGIWFNKDSKVWDISDSKTHIENCKEARGFKKHLTWAHLVYSELAFSDKQDLIQILPDAKDDLAKQYSNQLIEIATRFEPRLDEAFKLIVKLK